MRSFYIMLLSVAVLTLGLDLVAFQLTQHVPEDAVFNLGPVLGLLKEGRMTDLLVYKEFDTYFGYPPLFFLPQTLWHGLLGIDSGLVWDWVVVIHIALIVCFMYVFRPYIGSPIVLGLLAVSYCSGVYYLSGRPDPMAVLLILPVVGILVQLMDQWQARSLWHGSICLIALFFIHPLAFFLSGFVFFGTLLLTYRALHIKNLLVAGLAIGGCILALYLPFVLSDLPSWKALFLNLAKNQDRFKLSSFIKFLGLNAGAFLAMAVVVLSGGWNFFAQLFRSRLFLVSIAAMMIPFLWGASYYFLFVLPFLLASVVRLSIEYAIPNKWMYIALFLSSLLSVYQGSLGKVIQGLRNPGYGVYLSEARKKARESIPSGSPVYADSQLVADISHMPDVNLLWHGMKYYRNMIDGECVFVFVTDHSWASNKSRLGNWTETYRYHIMYAGPVVSGLPVLYRLSGKGPDLQFRIVKKIKK